MAVQAARVFIELIHANQNDYLVELINPLLEARPDQFAPIFNAALTEEHDVVYRQSLEMDRGEDRAGNG